jgi:hypothetical protein
MEVSGHLHTPPALPTVEIAEVVYYINLHSSERLKNWNNQRTQYECTQCQCEGRNSKKYVCLVLSYQTCYIHMHSYIKQKVYHVQRQNTEGIYQNSSRANYMTVMLQ